MLFPEPGVPLADWLARAGPLTSLGQTRRGQSQPPQLRPPHKQLPHVSEMKTCCRQGHEQIPGVADRDLRSVIAHNTQGMRNPFNITVAPSEDRSPSIHAPGLQL